VAFKGERREYRVWLSDVDRGVQVDGHPLVLAQHPSETVDHVTLRVLAWCMLYGPRVTFGPGVCEGDAPDLEVRDLTGRLTVWVGCGDVAPELARKVVQHNRDAEVHVVFGAEARRQAFVDEVKRWGRTPRGWERLSLWSIEERLVGVLATRGNLRQKWEVTVVGGRVYVVADGEPLEAEVTVTRGDEIAAAGVSAR
jgi:uncharacterized protein YaeQ